MITFNTDGTAMPKIKRRLIAAWIKQVAASHGFKTGEIAYIFCNDAKILEVNIEYLKHNYYTDIITFDYTEGNVIHGDIFISLDTVRSNAADFNTTFANELHRVIVHGVLHLCGQNDKTEIDNKRMHELEDEALVLLESMLYA